jgi:hypothetical protein
MAGFYRCYGIDRFSLPGLWPFSALIRSGTVMRHQRRRFLAGTVYPPHIPLSASPKEMSCRLFIAKDAFFR